MASAIIHMAIAKKVNKKLNRDERIVLLGGIAPDLPKCIGESKHKSHFYNNNDDRSGLDAFLKKYPNYLDSDYDTGYYIHLCSDYLWFNMFLPKIRNSSTKLTKFLDKSEKVLEEDDFVKLVYNDYMSLNIPLLDVYNLDLSLFYENFDIPNTVIEEVDIKNHCHDLFDKMGLLVKKSEDYKESYLFDINMIIDYVDECTNLILNELNNIKIK